MQFRAALASAAALFFAAQTMGAALDTGSDLDTRAVLIATDKYTACNCPNNCSHKSGSSCKYRQDGTNGSPTFSGQNLKVEFCQLTQEEALELLLEASGSWCHVPRRLLRKCRLLDMNHLDAGIDDPSSKLELGISDPELHKMAVDVALRVANTKRAESLSSLGFHSLVLPYERYRKFCRLRSPTSTTCDPSAAFGLHDYSDNHGYGLLQSYPKTIISVWEPGMSPPRSTWFADMIRSSLAQGHTALTNLGGKSYVVMCNDTKDDVRDFEIFMDYTDAIRLFRLGMSNFVENVVQGGDLDDLSVSLRRAARDLETQSRASTRELIQSVGMAYVA
ncbi:hypothetical protein PG993_012469 [Apiospora rasikravindrae]|uniref:Uncharacterized protein n=1 Tax=Apiospora rasikravindrae TaxID=990691 RepID=A0ABR1S2N8_9PEZI